MSGITPVKDFAGFSVNTQITDHQFEKLPKKKEYNDPLMQWPVRGMAFTNDIGAAIMDIAPKAGTAFWVPALMYFGADIYDKYKEFRRTVTRNAAIRNLDKYQEAVLEKWFFTYGYGFEIVEEALKKSVSLKNPSIATYDLYLTEWYQAGLRSKDAIIAYETEKKQAYQEKRKRPSNTATSPSGWGYEGQRKYDDAFFDALEKKAGNKHE